MLQHLPFQRQKHVLTHIRYRFRTSTEFRELFWKLFVTVFFNSKYYSVMKKAKLMLTAIAVFAVLATTFAFKSACFLNHFIYTGTIASGVCTQKVSGAAITNPAPGDTKVAAYVASLTSGCPDLFTIAITD